MILRLLPDLRFVTGMKVVVGELLRRWMPVFEGVRCDVQVTLRANSVTVQSGSDQGSSQARVHMNDKSAFMHERKSLLP